VKKLFVVLTVFVMVGVAACTPNPTPPTNLNKTGFSEPFSGVQRFESLAPTKTTDRALINVAIGQKRADAIARLLGLKKNLTLTDEQYQEFISGGGTGGNAAGAALADRSVQIFINTNGYPLTSNVNGTPTQTVLSSYGLFVDADGLLMSLANPIAPTRMANVLLSPEVVCPQRPLCAYINQWFLNNGATKSLTQLYRSAYTAEVVYGYLSQQASDPFQLVINTKGGLTTQVGMSMTPSIWITNFLLLYTLKPEVAALMPAYWTPIPSAVVDGILSAENSEGEKTGYVEYSEYASYFSAPN